MKVIPQSMIEIPVNMWHRLGAICAQQKWSDVVLVDNSNGLTIHLVITTQSLMQSDSIMNILSPAGCNGIQSLWEL